MSENIAGAVLAGGRSSRMGDRDKSFAALNDRPLIEQVITKAQPQVSALLISANQTDLYRQFKLPVINDVQSDHAGPLAGLYACMQYVTEHAPHLQWLATFPVDSPFYPPDLVKRLSASLEFNQADIAIPCYQGSCHWAFGLWPVNLLADLRYFLEEEQGRKVQQWLQRHVVNNVEFDDASDDPFFNINTPDDLAVAEQRIKNKHD